MNSMSFVHMILAHDFSGCACWMVEVRSIGRSYHEVSKLQLNSYFHFCSMIVVFIICLQYCLVGWLGFDTGIYNWWFSCCSWHIPKSGALHLHLLSPPLFTYSHIHHPPTPPVSQLCWIHLLFVPLAPHFPQMTSAFILFLVIVPLW